MRAMDLEVQFSADQVNKQGAFQGTCTFSYIYLSFA